MTLIAAIALGLASAPGDWRHDFAASWESDHPIYYTAYLGVNRSGQFWLPLTLAFGVIRLREPHRPRWRLRDQPGVVACVAVLAVLPFLMLINVLGYWRSPDRATFGLFQVGWMQVYFGPAVLGAWTIQRVGRRWRPEPGWIDALGSFLGGGWIAAFLADLALATLRPA